MVLTLQDDQVLRVYESVTDAVRDVEALDAEETRLLRTSKLVEPEAAVGRLRDLERRLTAGDE